MFGPRRDDLRFGAVASVLANANRGPRDKTFGPEDFVLRFERPATDSEVAEEEVYEGQSAFQARKAALMAAQRKAK